MVRHRLRNSRYDYVIGTVSASMVCRIASKDFSRIGLASDDYIITINYVIGSLTIQRVSGNARFHSRMFLWSGSKRTVAKMSRSKISSKPAKRSSKPASKTAAKKTAAKKKQARKAHDYAKLFAAAVKQNDGEPTSFVTSEAPNAARHGVGSHDRTSDGTISTKHRVAQECCKQLKAGKIPDVKALAKRFSDVKATTIHSWLSNWKRGIAGGAFYPSTIVDEFGGVSGVEKLFAKMQKKNG